MNNEILKDIPQPDPAWDYYIIWHSLLAHKAKIDIALKTIKDAENATDELDEEIYDLLEPQITSLILSFLWSLKRINELTA